MEVEAPRFPLGSSDEVALTYSDVALDEIEARTRDGRSVEGRGGAAGLRGRELSLISGFSDSNGASRGNSVDADRGDNG